MVIVSQKDLNFSPQFRLYDCSLSYIFIILFLQIINIIDIIVGGYELLHLERGQGGPQQQPPSSGREMFI